MKVCNSIKEFKDFRLSRYQKENSLGFVPTMGALHAGHLSLVQKALSENDHVAVSIFVNPIQFNKTSDLTAYPRTLKSDLRMLEEVMGPDDVVFTPEIEEMYPEPIQTQYDFGELANVMEGEHRPGHFNGVGIVVNRLFRIVEPDSAYFGEKDFQQVAIIRRLIEIESLAVKIVPCPILREPGGLALSSRNLRLTRTDRKNASNIFKILQNTRKKISSGQDINSLSVEIRESLNKLPDFAVEYVTFADENKLQPILQLNNLAIEKSNIRCFIAVMVGNVRLIDNLSMY